MGPAKSTAHRSRPGRWDVPAANEEDTGAPPSQVQAINHPVDKIARASAKNRHTCAHAASTPGCRPASPSSTPQNRPQHNRERRGADAFAFAHSRGPPEPNTNASDEERAQTSQPRALKTCHPARYTVPQFRTHAHVHTCMSGTARLHDPVLTGWARHTMLPTRDHHASTGVHSAGESKEMVEHAKVQAHRHPQ